MDVILAAPWVTESPRGECALVGFQARCAENHTLRPLLHVLQTVGEVERGKMQFLL